MSKKQTRKKKIWLLSIVAVFSITIIGGYIWYSLIYNPVISSYRGKSFGDVYKYGYESCMDSDFSDKMGVLKEPFCICMGAELANTFHDASIRKKDGEDKYYAIAQMCKEKTKFSTMSDKELKDLLEKKCKEISGAHRGEYCNCFGKIAVGLMREYSYESAIMANYEKILRDTVTTCVIYENKVRGGKK